MERCFIYGFVDPRTIELRYVGKSSRGMDEPHNHICNARRGATGCPRLYHWIRKLLRQGVAPAVFELEALSDDVTDATLDVHEVAWIAYARANGARLTNLTDGGGGGLRGYVPSAVVRAHYSAASRASWSDPEMWKRHNVAIRAAGVRPETKARRGAAQRAAWARADVYARRIKAVRAARRTKSSRAKSRAAMKAVWLRPEFRARQSMLGAADLYRALLLSNPSARNREIHAFVVDEVGAARAGPRTNVTWYRWSLRWSVI